MSVVISKTKCGIPVYKPETPVTWRTGRDAELMEAVDFYQHASLEFPHLGMRLFHVTNEGRRSFNTGALLKQAGLIKGVCDYIVLHPSGDHHFAVIELKQESSGSASKEQKQFLHECADAGGFVCIAHGYHAALYALREYLIPKCNKE